MCRILSRRGSIDKRKFLTVVGMDLLEILCPLGDKTTHLVRLMFSEFHGGA